MLFNSAVFLLLFTAVYSVYWFLPVRGKHYLIICASLVFYAWYSIGFLLMFLALIFLNYYVALYLLKNKSKLVLGLTVALDLSVLGFFKYFYLFAHSFGSLIGSETIANLKEHWLETYGIEIVLPIAISFYTFQIIAFVVDSFRGTINERVPMRQFFVFLLFFPQFIAGPILRASDFIPQINQPTATAQRIRLGSLLLMQGVVKKVLIADNLGAMLGRVWYNPDPYDGLVLVILPFAFLAQIYCDFSGYTDLARGMAKLLGYEIPENFTGPYLSKSLSELWTRWHITLSTWLRDYIYIPLGGSKISEPRTAVNLLITMGLGGFWHGATWNMLFWGLFIGIILVIERQLRVREITILPVNKTGNLLRVFYTFFVFGFSATLFAAPDLDRTWSVIEGALTFRRADPVAGLEAAPALILIMFLFQYFQYSQRIQTWFKNSVKLQYGLIFGGVFVVTYLVYMYGDVSGSFIYFAF